MFKYFRKFKQKIDSILDIYDKIDRIFYLQYILSENNWMIEVF